MNDAVSHANSETYFFRDHGQVDLLRLRLLPELIERRRGARTLRLWSAGCASGEEAYSLAMLLDMSLPERDGWHISILGSDIDQTALAKARRGNYGQWSFRMVPPALQQRYFHRKGEEWALDERIRRMVSFRAVDLIGEPFPGKELRDMDLILCRNVFIYFNAAAVALVADKLAATLNVGGYLMTGHTELIGHRVRGLQSRLFVESVVYQRVERAPDPPRPGLPKNPPLHPNSLGGGEAIAPSPAPAKSVPAGIGSRAAQSGETGGERSGGRLAGEGRVEGTPSVEGLLALAHEFADWGEYDRAERACRQTLALAPLAAGPHFLLAQLAQLRGDFQRARELLDKTLYVDPGYVAAYLELAALCERADNLRRAQTLRRAAADIVGALPCDAVVEPYGMTAAELAGWLAQ